MITIPGQLAIKTIHGRNGAFNVGRLTTSIGEFVTKNAELEQYREGKYEGEFIITEIRPSMYNTNGRMVIEIRAHLGGMTLSNIDALSKEDARAIGPHESDPVDEETPKSSPPSAATPEVTPDVTPPSIVATPVSNSEPFGFSSPRQTEQEQQADAALFGTLWPLGQVVKIDSTIDRRLIRKQRDRLDALGYEFEPRTQEWHRVAA